MLTASMLLACLASGLDVDIEDLADANAKVEQLEGSRSFIVSSGIDDDSKVPEALQKANDVAFELALKDTHEHLIQLCEGKNGQVLDGTWEVKGTRANSVVDQASGTVSVDIKVEGSLLCRSAAKYAHVTEQQ